MTENKFYVYGLIDPRDNTIFYIGKGKGKRVLQHLTEKDEIHSNTEKLKLINDIKREGLEVKNLFFCNNLEEKSAFLLEKLLIHRIGRRIFDEGQLTNIVPGGEWSNQSSFFLDENSLSTIEEINSIYPELVEPLNQYPHTAKVFQLKDKIIYTYNKVGERIQEYTIDTLIQIFGLRHALDIFNYLKKTDYPIFWSNRIWSKTFYPSLRDISFIPYQDGDIVINQFIEKVHEQVNNKEVTIQYIYPNGKLHCELNIFINELVFTYYYENGNTKHNTCFKDGKLNGTCQTWYECGAIKEIKECLANICLSSKEFYQTGKVKIENINDINGSTKISTSYYENGNVNVIINDEVTTTFNENGLLISKSIKVGDINNDGYILNYKYNEFGVLVNETKYYRKNFILHGYEKTFYETGELKRLEDFTNGIKNKIITNYTNNG